MQIATLSLVLSMSLVACGTKDDADDSGTTDHTDHDGSDMDMDDSDDDADADADATDADDGTDPETSFGLSGVVSDPWTSTPGAAGLCVTAADPSPALAGGDLAELASGVTGEGGTYELTGIQTASTLGIVVIVQDCPDTAEGEGTMYPTGTGVAFETYGELEDGAIATTNPFQLMNPTLTAFDAGLAEAGHVDADGEAATFTDQGGLVAFLLDGAGNRVVGGTVSCAAGTCPAFYNTQDAASGLSFMDGDEPATSTGVDGLAVLPVAPITTYSAEAGPLEFESRTMGSLPGVALFVSLTSEGLIADADDMPGPDGTAPDDDTGLIDDTGMTDGSDDSSATGADDSSATGSDDSSATGSDDSSATGGSDDSSATGTDDSSATGGTDESSAT